MNRFFSIFNFVGVAAIGVLCCAQWQTNGRLENSVQRLDQTRLEQSAKIADQERSLKDNAADLDDLRQRLSMSESELQTTIAQRDHLTAEDKQLKAALDKWIAAVKERDAALQKAGDLIQKLAGERNDAIVKFNELADKYNALVKQASNAQGN